ncbi:MAG: Asp-tRNA(Asn)/Glu-tRNA(Gln) amidotransferase subunit GatC [Chloroflexota bacterium]
MSLSIYEVQHIAHLARLELSGEEINRYRNQLSAILDHVTQLQKLDTANIQPTAGGDNTGAVLREDNSRPGLGSDVLLKTASEKHLSQYKMPPVFE